MSTLDYFVEKGKKQGRAEGIQEGIEKGEERKSSEVVKNLLLANKFSVKEIAAFANVSEAFVLKVKATI